MGVIPREVCEATARADVPDCSAGPMSLAMKDRRALAGYVKTLSESLLTCHEKNDLLAAKIEQLRPFEQAYQRLTENTIPRNVMDEVLREIKAESRTVGDAAGSASESPTEPSEKSDNES